MRSGEVPTPIPPVSPFTGSGRVTRVETFPVGRIIRNYRIQVGVDVTRFFRAGGSTIHEVTLFRCEETGYEFYWPPTTAGDERFYVELATQPWYYDPDRWEHRVGAARCAGAASVLDVGCGSGAFLEKVRSASPGTRVEGIETSGAARAAANGRGLTVHADTVEEFALRCPGSFEVVTAFQVLEHLPDPKSFLLGLLRAVRRGGRLLIGVPNDEGVLRETRTIPSYCLNLPPHHMGRWTAASLGRAGTLLGLEVISVEREAMGEEFLERVAYGRISARLGSGRWLGGGRFARLGGEKLAGLAWRLGLHRLYARVRGGQLRALDGHTILAEFRVP